MADESAMATDTPRKGDSKRKRVVDDGETPPSAHSVQSSLVSPHDEDNSAKLGDTVRIVETRPLSKLKRWRLDEVLERAR